MLSALLAAGDGAGEYYGPQLRPYTLGRDTSRVEMEHNQLFRTAADGRLPRRSVARMGAEPRDRGVFDLAEFEASLT